ncbi:MAG TPA: CatB-related O-acetyltransferase [Mucilaginibacter sp.]|jgi:acetyltransferase-like isoleucine patch superfamily enzyme
MKKFFRHIAGLFLKVFYPRLYFIEKNNAEVGRLVKNITTSKISKKAKILGTAQVGNSEIGDYTYVGSNSVINLTKIGKFCSIGPNLVCGLGIHPTNGLSTSPAFYSKSNIFGNIFTDEDKIIEYLPITIGNDVFIGMNVIVIDNVTIGDGAIIGAGSVVSKDIPPYAIAVGSPIRIIKYRFDQQTIDQLLKIKWWDFDDNELQDVERLFFNPHEFIRKYENKI